MKVLVTGAGGFLGMALVEHLLAKGFLDIRCLFRSRKDEARLAGLRKAWPKAQIVDMTGNLLVPDDAARAMDQVDIVFHAAAAMSGSAADMIMNTVVGSRNLLESVAHRSVEERRRTRVVLVSSFSVYGTAGLPRGSVITENTPLEAHPELREHYGFSKWRQEVLFREYQERHQFQLVIVRPGVIYGPGGSAFSYRVGMSVFGLFLHLGSNNILPLSYVDNCASAIIAAGTAPIAETEVFNVHDNELITSRDYLRAFKRNVNRIHSVAIPYWLLMLLTRAVETYHKRSGGQLPAVFTRYITATFWRGHRFDNAKLRSLGWVPVVSTEDGLMRAFAWLRSRTAK